MEEVVKNNKLIALFMGGKMVVEDRGINIIQMPSEIQYDLNGLRYNSSWDWLIPCVEKCLTVGDDSNQWDEVLNALQTVSIEDTYNAVVEFIKWYNENNS